VNFKTSQLSSIHIKSQFSCGKDVLDQYLKTRASQDIKRQISVCFVLSDPESIVNGYYTLSSTSIKCNSLPEDLARKYPTSYRNLPATLLGRLAVDIRFHGQGLGKILLIDALYRSYIVSKTAIGSMAVVVDPLDEEAEKFYTYYGFTKIPDNGKMFIPMTQLKALFVNFD